MRFDALDEVGREVEMHSAVFFFLGLGLWVKLESAEVGGIACLVLALLC